MTYYLIILRSDNQMQAQRHLLQFKKIDNHLVPKYLIIQYSSLKAPYLNGNE